jgi:class 3 adenylate cyclase/pimeloyl-ACP methyl ester carboxylesterase
MVPQTHYARSGDVRIAYQVVGDGPFDLVLVPGFVSNLDHAWEHPGYKHLLTRLSSFARLIVFDKRGTGLSDRVGKVPSLEQRMDDVRAVMDAVNSERAAVQGVSEGGAMAMLFAATYPDRTRSLVLYGTYAHFPTWAPLAGGLDNFISKLDDLWGTGASIRTFAPEGANDPQHLAWWARFERSSASPSAVAQLLRMNEEIDVRSILPAIRVPTVVIQRVADSRLHPGSGRYVASQIPGAKYVELPGTSHAPWMGDTDGLVDEIEEFLTGTRPLSEPDRVLATLMFTDIVDSTKRTVELGDRRWRQLLDQHDQIVRREIARHRGREVKTLGDGFLASFEGPARGVRCAFAIAEGIKPLGVEVRSGIHTGEIEIKGGDVGGIAVNVAARIAALAQGGQVLVSMTVRDLVAGSELSFRDHGSHALKGLPEQMRLFALQQAAGAP